MLPDHERAQVSWLHRLCLSVSWNAFTKLWGMRVEGWENIPSNGRVIIAFNHRSLLDSVMVPVVNRVRLAHSLAKEELFGNPVSAWFFTQMKSIPLNRSKADFGSMRTALAVLNGEGCILMAPEGTRSKTGVPGRPKPGVSFLAQQSGAPVVPCRLRNTERWPRLEPIEVRFGPPLKFDGEPGREGYQRFAEKVMEEIFKL